MCKDRGRSDVPTFSTLEELETLILEAEGDGDSIEMTPAEWQRLRSDSDREAALHRKAS